MTTVLHKKRIGRRQGSLIVADTYAEVTSCTQFRVQECADDVQNGLLSNLSRRFIRFFNTIVCGCVLKTFANVYSSVTFKLAYFNKY